MMSSFNNPFKVAGIGEILWDRFDTGKRLGGAPLNFCFHCSQFGAFGYPVSGVGTDARGKEIIVEVAAKGISDAYLERVPQFATGTVDVVLNERGQPTYSIHEPVAWDFMTLSNELLGLAPSLDAVCFGTLAQRNEVSRKSILEFLDSMPPDAFKIFDINIRQDFYSDEVVRDSLERCSVLKLSDEELPLLTKLFGLSGSVQQQLLELLNGFELQLIAYTRGANGSLLVRQDQFDDFQGVPSEVVNTVGAGDSFTATLCIGLLNGLDLKEINQHANRVAAYVCSQDTATPLLPDNLKKEMRYEN